MQAIKAFVEASPYGVFTALMVAGALYHWLQKAARGEASFNPVEYWLKDSPGYTGGTIAAFGLAWWGVIGGELLAGADWKVVVAMALSGGYTLNSAISPGTPILTGGAKQGGFVRLSLLPWLAALALAVAILLSGCAMVKQMAQPLHKSPSAEMSTVEKAQYVARAAIDEANAALTAVNRTITANVKAKVWTKDQAQGYLDESKKYGKQVDDAREALRLSNFANAEAQANAVKALILKLQQRIAVKARKEG